MKYLALLLLATTAHAGELTCHDLGEIAAYAAVRRDNGATLDEALTSATTAVVHVLRGDHVPDDEVIEDLRGVRELLRSVYDSRLTPREIRREALAACHGARRNVRQVGI